MLRTIQLLTISFAVFLLASTAQADRKLFLNDVDISSMRNETLEDCTVYIDANGDVHITSTRYRIEEQTTEETKNKTQTNTTKPTHRYFLVTMGTKQYNTQYDVDLYLNGQLVKRIKSSDSQTIVEVTEYLVVGDNQARITAIKNLDEPRKSYSRDDVWQIIIGEGSETSNQVTISDVQIKYERRADEIQNFDDVFPLHIQ